MMSGASGGDPGRNETVPCYHSCMAGFLQVAQTHKTMSVGTNKTRSSCATHDDHGLSPGADWDLLHGALGPDNCWL